MRPTIAVPVAVVSVTALVRRGQVKPVDQRFATREKHLHFLPWIVGDELPCLVVHVGKAVVEVGAQVSVNIVNVKLS